MIIYNITEDYAGSEMVRYAFALKHIVKQLNPLESITESSTTIYIKIN